MFSKYTDASRWSNEDWKKFKKVCFGYAKRFDRREENANEFVSFACEKILTGRAPIVKCIYIDFLRQFYGDSRSISGDLKSLDRRSTVQTDDVGGFQDYDSDEYRGRIVTASHDETPDRIYDDKLRRRLESFEINKLLIDLDGRDFEIFYLYFIKELTLDEVASFYLLTESRVCQLINKICKRLKIDRIKFKNKKMHDM